MTTKSSILFTFLFTISLQSLGQDTVRYHSLLAKRLLTESIELYPDNTFKWESLYDLSWSEFGTYNLDGNKLTMKHFLYKQPTSTTLSDTLKTLDKPFKITTYLQEGDKMYKLDNNGNKITNKKDKSIRTKWSWLIGHKHDFYYIKIKTSSEE